MPTLHGQQMLGDERTAAGSTTFHAVNPATSEKLEPAFHEGTSGEADRAMTLAAEAFDALRPASAEQRAALLEAIADQIMALGDELLDRCGAETGLPRGRLEAERGRTVNQTRLFATVVRDQSWLEVRIDTAEPDRKPMPKPDIRRMHMPVGPVAVFGASNFPLAISVAGTDTVSALGAGCPVVVKAHPGHPGTCELMARAIAAALKQCDLPAGAFSLLQGAGHDVGLALVKHPATKAVGFTGSLRGGRALFDAAAGRPEPIPVYAEMGSVNPIFLLPGALQSMAAELAAAHVQSVTLGVGQFCTNPGLVVGLEGEPFNAFVESVGKHAAAAAPATMLHAGIREAYSEGIARIRDTPGVNVVGESSDPADADKTQAACTVFHTDIATYEQHDALRGEVFGPASVLIEGESIDDLKRLAESLEGHLTATVHGTEDDLVTYESLIRILERKVGRLLFNGFPTGVEVCHAMHHGGPYPAATHSHFTSIGTASILRFVRPICYQNFPDHALPAVLKNKNPGKMWRMIDGEMTQGDVA